MEMIPKKIFLISLIFNLIDLHAYSQDYPSGTKYLKNVKAYTYQNNNIIQSHNEVFYLDSTSEIIPHPKKQKKTYWITITENESEKVEALIENGDTNTIIGRKFNKDGNPIFNYQIFRHDTVIKQIRFFNQFKKDSLLLTWKEGNIQRLNKLYKENIPVPDEELKFRVTQRWFYNEDSLLIKVCTYNFDGDSTITIFKYSGNNTDEYEFIDNEFKLIESKTNLENNREKLLFFKDSQNFDYGIDIMQKKDGYAIREFDDSGRLILYETFSKSGTKINSIKISYTEVK